MYSEKNYCKAQKKKLYRKNLCIFASTVNKFDEYMRALGTYIEKKLTTIYDWMYE